MVAHPDPRPTRVSPEGPYGGERPGGWADPMPVFVDWPADQYPPGNASNRSQFGLATIATGAAFTTLAVLEIPANSLGVIRDVEAVTSGTITAATDVRWRLLVGATPLSGWEDLRLHPVAGAAALIYQSLPESTFIRLAGGQSVTLQARVLAGGPLVVSMRVRGWTWG